MVEKGRGFIWVEMDRDKVGEAVKEFNVSAYPTILVLNGKRQKVHRFSGFRKADAFVKDLQEGLDRWKLFVDGKEWDTPTPRPEKLSATGVVTAIPAPSEENPAGLALLDGDLWVASGYEHAKLHRVDRKNGKVLAAFDLPEGVRGLATDGKSIYALSSGWTCGKPIWVFDPKTGKELRQIVTEANAKNQHYGASGLAFRDGRLYVLEGMLGKIYELDPETGAIKATIETKETWLTGFACNGSNFISSTKGKLLHLDPEKGKVVGTSEINYPVSFLAVQQQLFYVQEQPVFGFDKDHKSIRIWPEKGKTVIYLLDLSLPK